jgi:Asp-tRNA(Asn)/Glu-tRNA(Gln) amidotransferase A subunit family amidase
VLALVLMFALHPFALVPALLPLLAVAAMLSGGVRWRIGALVVLGVTEAAVFALPEPRVGLAALAGGLHRLPRAVTRLSRLRRVTDRFYRDHDVLLTPTLADETPRIGHLDPTADYQQIIDRLVDWVAFTPLQNATGEPAISLPLARSSAGMPIGMMFGGPIGTERRLLELAYELEAARPRARIQDVDQLA